MMRTKATVSVGTAKWINTMNGRVKKSDGIPTKDKAEGHLGDRESRFNCGKTQVIRIQRNWG